MELILKRSANVLRDNRAYCIGHLFVNGEYFCDTLEDFDRGLDTHDDIEHLYAQKVAGKTAIPTGQYDVDMGTVSCKYMKKKFYMDYCRAMMPRLCFVVCYEGVLIHPGNTEDDTEGCILVGQNKEVGKVINSKDTWCKLYEVLQSAWKRGEGIRINVMRTYTA